MNTPKPKTRNLHLASILASTIGLLFSLLTIPACAGRPSLASPTPDLSGCPIFPADNIWNVPVDTLPVDANSDLYITTIGASDYVHADFGSGLWEGGPIGHGLGGFSGLFDQVGCQSVLTGIASAAIRAGTEPAIQVDQVVVCTILGTDGIHPGCLVGDMAVERQLQGFLLPPVESGLDAVAEACKHF